VQLYVDGTWMSNFNVTQYETKMGPIAAGDSRIFTFTETDLAGNLSVPTVGLRALPPLAGGSVADAAQALAAAGFAVGTVTHERSAAAANTVIAPADVQVLPLGSAIDLTVSTGAGSYATPFKLRVVAPTLFRPARRRAIFTSVALTVPATATIVLLDSRGHRLASWRRPLRAGMNHPRLRLPTPVRQKLIHRPGLYWLSWSATATSTGDRATVRKRVHVIAPPLRFR
jgi:hypothetical protein